MLKEALNKSIQDVSEHVKLKCDFNFTYKIKYLKYLILAAHPCAAGTSDIIRGSLIIYPRDKSCFSITIYLR
jgi:hypothetical protein